MKIKKVLTTSMLCALPVAKSFADETEKVKVHSTSIEEVNNSLISESNKVLETPSVAQLKKVTSENEIYSLVTEEDTKMPELEENSYYVKKSLELIENEVGKSHGLYSASLQKVQLLKLK